jgi:hypothetical protein
MTTQYEYHKYKFYGDISSRNGPLTSYRLITDECSVCGEAGGAHHSKNGISWCYNDSDRGKYIDNPRYQTSFSYAVTDKSNPNTTFKNRGREE